MIRYVALLGSINVGGNRLKMADLRAELDRAGLGPVETVVASGNVILPPGETPQALERAIAAILSDRWGIAGLVTVRTAVEIASAVADNPFHGDGQDRFVHTIFLNAQPAREAFDALYAEHRGKGSERLALGERVLYLDFVHGAGVSSLTGPLLERRLKCRGTARNMRSLKRIIERLV